MGMYLQLSASVLKVAQVSLRSLTKKSYRHCLQDTKAKQRWKMGVWLKKNREERQELILVWMGGETQRRGRLKPDSL